VAFEARTRVEEARSTEARLLILTLGFAAFMSSYLYNIYWFGMLIAMAAVIAFLADGVVAPALRVLATRNDRTP
jgi:predicted RND superfamily exporter protein